MNFIGVGMNLFIYLYMVYFIIFFIEIGVEIELIWIFNEI